MKRVDGQAERLLFLANVVRREVKHLLATDGRLFALSFTLEMAACLNENEDLAERVDAFVSRFGRLQDTLGDKLLPNLLLLLGETPRAAVDNLERAERLGWIRSTDEWLATRRLRNQMVHEYIQLAEILVDALNEGHRRVADLVFAAEQMLTQIEKRVGQ